MALYQSWNREDMKQAGPAVLEPSTTNHTSSFTPINYNYAQPQFISPSRTLLSRALDADALYDLPHDVPPKAVPPKGRKRGATTAGKGRAVFLGAVWEYNGDEYLQEGHIDNPVTKKRKVAPKRSKSTKGPSTTLSEFRDAVDDIHQDDEQQNSQLTTPPDSGKKTKRRTASSASLSKAKKLKPFKNPTITKPSVVREKESRDNPPSSKAISTHRGWTTTEDALRTNCNGIAETTLDKLAAFRYKPSTDSLCPKTPTHPPEQGASPPGLAHEHTLQLGLPEVGHSSSDYGPIPSFGSMLGNPVFQLSVMQVDDRFETPEAQNPETIQLPDNEMMLDPTNEDFFADALWNVRSSNQVASSNLQDLVNQEVHEPQSDQLILSLHQRPQPDGSTHPNTVPSQPAQVPANLCLETTVSHESAHTDIFEPTSSEARALGCLLDYVGNDGHIQQVSETIEIENLPTLNQVSVAYLFSENAIEYEHDFDASIFEAEEEAAALESFPDANQNLTELRPCSHSSVHPQMRGQVIEFQVERSNVDDIEATSTDVSKDHDSDEFGEGLDESDLLGIVSDAIVPDTQFNAKANAGDKYHKLLQNRPMDSVSAQDAFISRKPVGLTLKTTNPERGIGNDLPALQMLSSQPEDEYPMDEDDEDMFRLPNLMTTGVIEKFQAPASIQYAFGDELGLREVYDSSLQFSPPRPWHAMNSPQKLRTDKANTVGSPAHRLETDPVPLGEEEDWKFLRSGHAAVEAQAQMVMDANPELLQAIVEGGSERLESASLHSSRAHFHPPDSAYTSVSATQTEFSSMRILDDSHEYKTLQPFARPEFSMLTRDRSPITGVSAQTFLRVCFRIGEMFREGARCEALKQDAVIELFARVTFSSREPGTTKQHFQFADIWHDRPPFPNGVLANYKTSGLVENESKVLLDADEDTLARCLGRLKRDSKSATGWMLHILNIRVTDWEEIRWTRRIVSAGLVKSVEFGSS